MNTSAQSILLESLRDLRRTWPQLVLTDLLMRALAVVVLVPLVGLLLRLFLATTATGVVSDAAILGFLMHPTGMAALLVVGTVSLGLLFAETGQLMVIGFGATEDRLITWIDAFRYAFARVSQFLRVGWYVVLRLLLIALPFLVVGGGLYWLLVRQHDINYFLAQKPPEFLAFLAVVGLLLAAMALLLIARFAGWLLALPMVLFEGMDGKEAVLASERATTAQRRRIALWLWGWLAAVALLSWLSTFIVRLLGDVLIPYGTSNLTLLLVGLATVIVASAGVNLLVSMFAAALFPLLVVRLYLALGGAGELSPEVAPRGSLGEKASWRIPAKGVLATAAVLLLVGTAGAYALLGTLDQGNPAQIIGHRGGAAVAPENTMAAFRHGIADGADWLELDVQEDADGVVVVEHDHDFMRVAGASLNVWDATSAELADLDVGSFFDASFSGERVPTLREVLELSKGQAGVFIELKYYGHDIDLEQKVVDLVEATGMESNIVVMSLEYDGVRKIAALRPDWTYGLLNTVSLGDVTRLDLDFLALSAPAATYSMIRRAHERDMKLYAWTIDDPVQMTVMMSRGVDGIITNQVALARQVQDLRAKLTPLGRFVVWMAGEAGLLRGMEKSSARDDA
jgi:glycerophosphoryl diester phosphodiesterase